MRLNQLEYLQAINKYGSISKAAEALFVSQPSISNSIKELELELNCQLLTRSNHGIQFTPKGKKILNRIPLILSEIDAIKKIARSTNPLSDHYSIAGPSHLANYVLIPVIEILFNSYNYTFDVRIGSSSPLIAQLNSFSLDFGLIYLESVTKEEYEEANRHGIVFTPLYKEPLLIVCDSSNELVNREIKLGELNDYRILDLYDLNDSSSLKSIRQAGNNNKVTKILDPVGIRSTLTKTKSVSFMSLTALIAGNLLYPYDLNYLKVKDFSKTLTIVLAYNKVFSNSFIQPIKENILDNVRKMTTMDSRIEYTDDVRIEYIDSPIKETKGKNQQYQ